MATKYTPGADGGADETNKVTRQLKAANLNETNELKIMTMSLKHGSWGKYKEVKISRGTTKMIIKSKSPDIIFLQDIPAPESEVHAYFYEYTDKKQQVGMMWHRNSLGQIGKIITIEYKNAALNAVIGDDVNPHLREISSRTCVVLLKQRSNDNHILAISWHADSAIKIEQEQAIKIEQEQAIKKEQEQAIKKEQEQAIKKEQEQEQAIKKEQENTLVFPRLLDFALEIAKRIAAKENISKGQPLPVVIGGHFNLDLNNLEPGFVRNEFVLCEYKRTNRKQNEAIIDYFLYSGDVTVEDVQALELNKDSPKFSFTAEETEGMDQDQLYALDYDPILGRLLFQPGGSGARAGVEKQGPTGTGDVYRCQ